MGALKKYILLEPDCIDLLTLTGLTLSRRGMPLLWTAWNCSWLNSVAILSRIWPASKGLQESRKTLGQSKSLKIHILLCIFLDAKKCKKKLCQSLNIAMQILKLVLLSKYLSTQQLLAIVSHLLSSELVSLEFCEWRIFSIFSTERTTWISLNTQTWWKDN